MKALFDIVECLPWRTSNAGYQAWTWNELFHVVVGVKTMHVNVNIFFATKSLLCNAWISQHNFCIECLQVFWPNSQPFTFHFTSLMYVWYLSAGFLIIDTEIFVSFNYCFQQKSDRWWIWWDSLKQVAFCLIFSPSTVYKTRRTAVCLILIPFVFELLIKLEVTHIGGHFQTFYFPLASNDCYWLCLGLKRNIFSVAFFPLDVTLPVLVST